jgi:hypothetical protein
LEVLLETRKPEVASSIPGACNSSIDWLLCEHSGMHQSITSRMQTPNGEFLALLSFEQEAALLDLFCAMGLTDHRQ